MDTLPRAREYLVKAQCGDGSWGSGDPFVCARAMCALLGAMPDETLAKGLRYLEASQASDGHFSPRTGMYSDASSTAYTLIVLNRFDYGKASLPVSRGILWLLENQNEDGSWGVNKKKKAFTTTFSLRALYTFYLSGLARFSKGLNFSLDYLRDLEFMDEPVSHVYAPILNLERIGYLDAAMEKKFLDYALEASGSAVKNGNIADAAYILGTLKALDEGVISATLEKWLVSMQNVDGGFGNKSGEASGPNWTALTALAIENRL